MTGPALLLLALALVAALVDWIAVARGNRALEYVAKPLTLALLLAAVLAFDDVDPTVRAWFVAALALSLLGDVLLMLPSDRFVAGLAAFLLGHVAYIGGLHAMGVEAGRLLAGAAIVLVAVGVLGAAILRAVRAGDEPGMAGPVVAYMAVISVMVASAVGTGDGVAIAGATSFYVSDALIAWDRFRRPVPHGRVWIMVTYHLGQLGLVLSLL